jgi:hypothetical protein
MWDGLHLFVNIVCWLCLQFHCVAIGQAGFQSAHYCAHQCEPRWTFPTPIQASTKDIGDENCLDYVFIKGKVKVDTSAPHRGVSLLGVRWCAWVRACVWLHTRAFT